SFPQSRAGTANARRNEGNAMRIDVACRRHLTRVLVVMALVGACVGGAVARPKVAQAAAGDATGSITLGVESARTVQNGPGFVHQGDPVDSYKWLINIDDTGDPGTATQPGFEHCLPATASAGSSDPTYADSCPWPSTRPTSGFAPIVAQGDQSDLNTSTALD